MAETRQLQLNLIFLVFTEGMFEGKVSCEKAKENNKQLTTTKTIFFINSG